MLRVLLVEDSESDAFIIQKAIKDHIEDVRCIRTDNLAKGEALLQEEEFDVILLDLGLPDSTCPSDTYTRISKCAGKIPIVISTNITDHELAVSLVHDGAEDFLSKDMIVDNPEHVRDAIEFAIERHLNLLKTVTEKEEAVKDSEKKDAMLNCFMGGYSVSNKK